MSAGHPLVSIVIPVLDPGPILFDCLGSIATDAERVEIVVVDNGSSDGAAQEASARYPQLRLIRNETNMGFARGSNMGAAAAAGRYILFLNGDAVLPIEGLYRLLTTADADDAAAIWQPVVRSPKGEIENAGEYFTWSGFLIRKRHAPETDAQPYAVFAGTAACLLIRRNVFEKVGGFQDAYFAYIEDVDLCWRTRLAGWEVRVVPSVTVTHAKSVTTRRIFAPHEIRYLTFRNRLATILANGSVVTLIRVVPLYVLACLVTILTLLTSGRGRSAYAIVRALLWPVAHRGELMAQRRRIQSARTVRDPELLRADLRARWLGRDGWALFRDQYRHWEES